MIFKKNKRKENLEKLIFYKNGMNKLVEQFEESTGFRVCGYPIDSVHLSAPESKQWLKRQGAKESPYNDYGDAYLTLMLERTKVFCMYNKEIK